MLTNHYRTRDYRVARSLTDAFGPYAQLSVEKRKKLAERLLDVLCMLCFGIGAVLGRRIPRGSTAVSVFLEKPLKLSFTVEVREGNCGFDVVIPDGRRCDGLGWDELLGQIAHLTHPQLGKPRYQMLTPQEWEAHWEKVRNMSLNPAAHKEPT